MLFLIIFFYLIYYEYFRCGYTDLEIAMFFNRYNINLKGGINEKHLEKLEQDLNKYNFDQEIKRYNQEALMEGYVHVNEFLMYV